MIELVEQSTEQDSQLDISQICRTLSLSRATFYRSRDSDKPVDSDIELRDKIQQIALDMPSYGYRRITKALARNGQE